MVEKTDYKNQSKSSDSFTRSNNKVHEIPRHWEEEIPLDKIKFMQKDRIR